VSSCAAREEESRPAEFVRRICHFARAVDDVKFRFSERYDAPPDDEWFDVMLPSDTRLFVDPFRVYAEKFSAWVGAHDELIDFFNLVLELMAKASLNPASQHWQAASELLMFPEPVEFCLGYALGSDGGRGSAKERRDQMLAAGSIAINAGMSQVSHFEEMTLFQGRVGPDLVSDIACNVLKQRFIAYTQDVCKRFNIETKRVPVKHSSWSRKDRRWDNDMYELPYNPWTKAGVLLVPRQFLRQLPTIEGNGFWDFAFNFESNNIKGQFQYDIARNVSSQTIADLAQQNPDLVRKFVRRFEKKPPAPYNVERDPKGRTRWYEAGLELAEEARTVAVPDKAKDFCSFVGLLCQEFVWVTEQRGGWRLLWNTDGSQRAESAVQQLFHVAMIGYCKANDIDLSPESAAGRGPVDFKFSKGWKRRALVEVKLSNNSRFWHGLDTQTPTYMTSEGIRCGYFLAVQYTDNDLTKDRIQRVRDKAKAVSGQCGYTIKPVFVDARPKKSASKV
jgi:hypothetical protein